MTSIPKGPAATGEAVRLWELFCWQAKMIEIYALLDPDTHKVRYIGKSVNSLERFKQHMSDARRQTPLRKWIESLISVSKKPTIQVIAMTKGDWQELEILLIKQYKDDGFDLLNISKGGNQPECSPRQRSKNAKKLNERIGSSAFLSRVRLIRKSGVDALRSGAASKEAKEAFLFAATSRPDLFKCWLKYL